MTAASHRHLVALTDQGFQHLLILLIACIVVGGAWWMWHTWHTWV